MILSELSDDASLSFSLDARLSNKTDDDIPLDPTSSSKSNVIFDNNKIPLLP